MDKNIQVVHTALDNYKCTGLVERRNQTLIGHIRRILAEGPHHIWLYALSEALHAIRTTCITVTKVTPFALWHVGLPEWSKDLENMVTARHLANSRLKLVD